MSRSVLTAAFLAAAVTSCGGDEIDGARGPTPTANSSDPVRTDDRIAPLLEPCGVTNVFDVNTSDMLPRMIEKLEAGHLDPLKRAKEELGRMGPRAVPALQRFIERNYGTTYTSGFVENALDALALNEAEEARPVILHCLDHPQESVRLRAGRTLLAGHARPEDFDTFLARLEGGETFMMKKLLARLLYEADPARAEALYLDWIRDGRNRPFQAELIVLLPASRSPETAARCAELFATVEEPWRAAVAAPAARVGDEAALAYLVALKDAPEQNTRLAAAQAMVDAGLGDILVDWLLDDPDEFVRAKAAEGLAAMEELAPAYRDALTVAMDDASPRVSAYALRLLCERGDPEANDRALTYLRGGETELLQSALQALRDPLTRDPELVRRAWTILRERAGGEAHMPVTMRTATLKAIGTIPLPEAAEYLHRTGVENAGETIEGLPAHRWLMIAGGNTGEAGRHRLAELLDTEDDPLRRLDLIQAVGSTRTAASRIELQRICEERARTPFEVLFCASLLVKVGPADEVADRLKRVYFRLGSGEVFLALECLLWEWY